MNATTITIEHGGAAPDSAADVPAPHRVSAFDLVAAQPWAITPAMLQTIAAIARRENEPPQAVEARLGRPLQNARAVTLRGSVAIVPVTGPVFRYANLFTELSGATSLEVLAKDFTAALDDPAVTAIVLNMDSPGGQAAGIGEFAQMVRAANKPVIAYVGATAASAAYWIAAAADRIVLAKTAEVGSIGAVVSIDPTRSKTGAIEIVSSQSPKKRPDLSTPEGKSLIQARIDALAQVFVEDVADYRGTDVSTVLEKFGQGDMRMGAEAVALGMADSIGTLESVIAELSGKTNPTSRPKGKPMAPANPTAQAPETQTITADYLAANHPDLVASFRAEGASAERARILDVEAQALPGHEALIAGFKADGKTTGPMAAVAILAAERTSNAARLENLRADAPKPVPHAAAPEGETAGASLEDRCKAKWDADKNLRAEFGGKFDAFLAYEKASAAGSVRSNK